MRQYWLWSMEHQQRTSLEYATHTQWVSVINFIDKICREISEGLVGGDRSREWRREKERKGGRGSESKRERKRVTGKESKRNRKRERERERETKTFPPFRLARRLWGKLVWWPTVARQLTTKLHSIMVHHYYYYNNIISDSVYKCIIVECEIV